MTQNIQAEVDVVEVIGGDIYRLSTGEEVRLAGVRTKEIRRPRKHDVVFSDEALNYIALLVKSRKQTVVDSRQKLDRKGRRQVFLHLTEDVKRHDPETGLASTKEVVTLLNLEIIRLGYGRVKWWYRGAYHKSFKAAERFAKRSKLGLWRS